MLQQTKPCLDVYSSVWPSIPAGLRIHIQNSFGPPKVKTCFFSYIFPNEKINLLPEFNEGKFCELFVLL